MKKYFKITNYINALKSVVRGKYKKSHSQNGEDIIVKFIFDSIGIKTPSYIDIGAHDPLRMSNTALFYSLGSKGINIEPDPELFQKITHYRKRDINLNIGISREESEMDFYIMSHPALSTFSKEAAMNAHQEGGASIIEIRKIRTTTIPGIISKYWNNKFPDFLSIDVEGLDLEILKSINFSKTFPKVICAETISYSLTGRGEKNLELIHYIENNGYLLFADTYINSIFVKRNLWQR